MTYDSWIAKAARQRTVLESAARHDVVPQSEHFPMTFTDLSRRAH